MIVGDGIDQIKVINRQYLLLNENADKLTEREMVRNITLENTGGISIS